MKREDFISDYTKYEMRSITIISHRKEKEKVQFKCTKGLEREKQLDQEMYLLLDDKHLVDKIISDYLKNNTNIKRRIIHKDDDQTYQSTEYRSFEGALLRLIFSRDQTDYKNLDAEKDVETDIIKKYRDLIDDSKISNIIISSGDKTSFKLEKFATTTYEKEHNLNNNLIITIAEKKNQVDHIAVEKTKELLNYFLNYNKDRVTNVLLMKDKYGHEELVITLEGNCVIIIKDKQIAKEFEVSINKSRKYMRVRKEG